MNVGAIGAYRPVSHINPYATNAKAQASDVTKIGQDAGKKVDKTDPNYECQTCENRKYQDGSDEHDVSFKNAAKVAPEAASSAVRSHEQMHVKNAYEKADSKPNIPKHATALKGRYKRKDGYERNKA